ncbi:MAG: Xaa-Pro peptidase family protein [Oscillospiraceae bacterium]
MNFTKRMSELRKKLAADNLDGIVVPLDASMEYLTGVPRLSMGNTKQRQMASEYECMLVTSDRAAVFLSDLHSIVTGAKLGNTKPEVEFFQYENGDYTAKTLTDYLEKNKLYKKRIAVMSDVPAPVILRLVYDFAAQVTNGDSLVFDLRSVKDELELKALQKASDITDKVYYDLLDKIEIGASVKELELLTESLLVKHGASKNSFAGDLNCFGPKAGAMVGDEYHTIEKGYVLGLDIGVYCEGYCSDFGRTIFIGEPTQQQKEIFKVVNNGYNQSVKLMMEGVSCHDIHMKSREVLEKAGYGENYIHKLGHGIGMDVHEHPLLTKGNYTPLKNSMVFAVEPSVLIPHNCVIRNEDMVVVAPEGAYCLSKVSHELTVIE